MQGTGKCPWLRASTVMLKDRENAIAFNLRGDIDSRVYVHEQYLIFMVGHGKNKY